MGLRTIMAGAALAGALCAAGGAWAEPGGAAPARPARIFDHLTGCWSVEGTVRGRPVTNFAKGRWILDGAYFLQARLNVSLPGIDPDLARVLVEEAHQTCPYSKATRGNIDVSIRVV